MRLVVLPSPVEQSIKCQMDGNIDEGGTRDQEILFLVLS